MTDPRPGDASDRREAGPAHPVYATRAVQEPESTKTERFGSRWGPKPFSEAFLAP